MRRPPVWFVVGVVVAAWAGPPARAADGFWVTAAAGAAGAAEPSDYAEFWFDSPHAPPVAVTRFTGPGTAQATTAGGNTFFSGAATPILLPTADGYATLTNPEVANGAGGLPRFAGGARASGAPQDAPGPVPADSNRLAVDFGEAAADGSQVLTVAATDPAGATLGKAQVTVRAGDWWVIGLGPGAGDGGDTPDPDPVLVDDDVDVVPVQTPAPLPVTTGGAVTTPEPASVVLLGVGGVAAAGWRRLRRR